VHGSEGRGGAELNREWVGGLSRASLQRIVLVVYNQESDASANVRFVSN